MKDKVIQIVRHSIGCAEDNLYRAQSAMAASKLNEEHGQSGRKRQDILDEYEEDVRELKKCLEWASKAEIP